MDKSVWVVDHWEYSDYSVIAAFSTEEKARSFCEQFPECEYHEMDLDPEFPDGNQYFVKVKTDFTIIHWRTLEYPYNRANGWIDYIAKWQFVDVYVRAKSPEDARKVAIDIARANVHLFVNQTN